VYRYRLIDEKTGDDIGPLISTRLTFAGDSTKFSLSGRLWPVII
jgi:hypothetical protein